MSRHSRRNTALAYFTSYERSEAAKNYGSQSQRLSAESFIDADSCLLCLMAAVDPVACEEMGHIFCRSCIYENLVSQSLEIKDIEKQNQAIMKEAQENHKQQSQQAKEKDIRDFERLEQGITETTTQPSDESSNRLNTTKQLLIQDKPTTTNNNNNNKKRSFQFDVDEAQRSEQERLDGVQKKIARDNQSSGQDTSEAFWDPSKAPSAAALHQRDLVNSTDPANLKKVPKTISCPGAGSSHALSRKLLVDVHFSVDNTSSSSGEDLIRICPCCRRLLHASIDIVLSKPCGHVICLSCFNQVVPQDQVPMVCAVCETVLTPAHDSKKNKKKSKIKPGIVKIIREGTGFSSGGKAMVKKRGIVFQA